MVPVIPKSYFFTQTPARQGTEIRAGSTASRSTSVTGTRASSLGVKDRRSFWECLGRLADQDPAIAALDFDALVARAIAEYDSTEQ